jgi:single-strand DNA-binding protein
LPCRSINGLTAKTKIVESDRASKPAQSQKLKIMNAIVNKVQLIGRLGMDPEMKKLDNGSTLARLSLATDASYKDKSGKKIEETHWHNLVCWNKTAELAEQLLSKGKEVAIEGKLIPKSYEDGEGNRRYVTEVRVEQFLLFGKKGE